jgi:SAM-dependent methyltransferase
MVANIVFLGAPSTGKTTIAERMARELDARVIALDQSERMVELTKNRGVEAIAGNVEDLPFRDGIFDCAVAVWMLYHAQDLDLALCELRRVVRSEGRVVTATSSERNLGELWELVGEIGAPADGFTAENAEWSLLRHFTIVQRRDIRGTVTFPDRESAYQHMQAVPTRGHLAERLPLFEGPLVASRHVVVFVAEP